MYSCPTRAEELSPPPTPEHLSTVPIWLQTLSYLLNGPSYPDLTPPSPKAHRLQFLEAPRSHVVPSQTSKQQLAITPVVSHLRPPARPTTNYGSACQPHPNYNHLSGFPHKSHISPFSHSASYSYAAIGSRPSTTDLTLISYRDATTPAVPVVAPVAKRLPPRLPKLLYISILLNQA
jgi:hypothetical protein